MIPVRVNAQDNSWCERERSLDGRCNFPVHMFIVAVDTISQSLRHRLKVYSFSGTFFFLFSARAKPNTTIRREGTCASIWLAGSEVKNHLLLSVPHDKCCDSTSIEELRTSLNVFIENLTRSPSYGVIYLRKLETWIETIPILHTDCNRKCPQTFLYCLSPHD